MSFLHLRLERAADGIALLTIHRPEKLNALNNTTMAELDDALRSIRSDPAVHGLIVTGAGEKAFVAGADISELVDATPLDGKARCLRDQAVMRRLETMGKPSIAAINGLALGGGLELALCCTLRVAASHARLGFPEIKIGVFPANGGTQRLPRLVGRGRALEMMLTGRPIEASEAERIGLVNHVVPGPELLDFSRRLVGEILDNAPVAASLIMECVDVGLRGGLDEGLQFEAAAYAAVSSTEDRREGTSAFLEKRKPEFRGR
jgi:enoyl-CoA hydratase